MNLCSFILSYQQLILFKNFLIPGTWVELRTGHLGLGSHSFLTSPWIQYSILYHLFTLKYWNLPAPWTYFDTSLLHVRDYLSQTFCLKILFSLISFCSSSTPYTRDLFTALGLLTENFRHAHLSPQVGASQSLVELPSLPVEKGLMIHY